MGFSFHTVTIFCVHVVSEPVLIRGHPTTLALTIALGNCRIYDKQDAVQKIFILLQVLFALPLVSMVCYYKDTLLPHRIASGEELFRISPAQEVREHDSSLITSHFAQE